MWQSWTQKMIPNWSFSTRTSHRAHLNPWIHNPHSICHGLGCALYDVLVEKDQLVIILCVHEFVSTLVVNHQCCAFHSTLWLLFDEVRVPCRALLNYNDVHVQWKELSKAHKCEHLVLTCRSWRRCDTQRLHWERHGLFNRPHLLYIWICGALYVHTHGLLVITCINPLGNARPCGSWLLCRSFGGCILDVDFRHNGGNLSATSEISLVYNSAVESLIEKRDHWATCERPRPWEGEERWHVFSCRPYRLGGVARHLMPREMVMAVEKEV